MPFDPKKPIQFRSGPEQVRILATDLRDDRPIVIAVTVAGKETVGHRHADGRVQSGRDNVYDLVNVPKKHEVWINLYDTEEVFFGCAYPTREQANANANANINRTACVRVEFTEGEGL